MSPVVEKMVLFDGEDRRGMEMDVGLAVGSRWEGKGRWMAGR